MKVLVSGAGRGGTNLLSSLIVQITGLVLNGGQEDRQFFQRKKINDNYIGKLATENPNFTKKNIKKVLDENEDLKICFVLRNPIDNCLSKIYRGRPNGDKINNSLSADATEETSVNYMKKLYDIIDFLHLNYSERIILIKMNDIISKPEYVTRKISTFIDVIPKNFEGFQKNNQNTYQKKRYSDVIHKSQIDTHKNIDSIYDGFFSVDTVEYLKKELNDIIIKYKSF